MPKFRCPYVAKCELWRVNIFVRQRWWAYSISILALRVVEICWLIIAVKNQTFIFSPWRLKSPTWIAALVKQSGIQYTPYPPTCSLRWRHNELDGVSNHQPYADRRKHQCSASLAFVRGIHRGAVNSPHKWPVTRKCFHLMTSLCTM